MELCLWQEDYYCETIGYSYVNYFIISPTSTKLNGGLLVSCCPSVHLSFCLWTEPCLLFIFNDFLQIFEICNFDFVLFWLGIHYELIVLVIMGQWEVSSECRDSIYSRYHWRQWKLPLWQPSMPSVTAKQSVWWYVIQWHMEKVSYRSHWNSMVLVSKRL